MATCEKCKQLIHVDDLDERYIPVECRSGCGRRCHSHCAGALAERVPKLHIMGHPPWQCEFCAQSAQGSTIVLVPPPKKPCCELNLRPRTYIILTTIIFTLIAIKMILFFTWRQQNNAARSGQ